MYGRDDNGDGEKAILINMFLDLILMVQFKIHDVRASASYHLFFSLDNNNNLPCGLAIMVMVERLKARFETWLKAIRLAGAKADVTANMVVARNVFIVYWKC